MLVLKISNSEFRAFDNCCPHNGSKNAHGRMKMKVLNVLLMGIAFPLMEMM